jgi:hypothetical protein
VKKKAPSDFRDSSIPLFPLGTLLKEEVLGHQAPGITEQAEFRMRR